MSLLTCKDFIDALNDFLDETADADLREQVEAHISKCPNCWVVLNTTQKTLKVFRGYEHQELPEDVHTRLMERLQQKINVAPSK